MKLELIFTIANSISFLCWIFLFVFYQKRWIYRILFSFVIILFSCGYLYFLINGLGTTNEGGFDTLEKVKVLFASDKALLAGWIHYLTFDLFVGMWISKSADQLGINRWVLLPCLILTFMAGPLGLFLFIIIKAEYSKKFPLDPFAE